MIRGMESLSLELSPLLEYNRFCLTRSQVPSQSQVRSKLLKLRNCGGFGARSQLSALKGVEGCAEAPGLDQEEGQAIHSLEPASNQPTSWLVHILEHPWCQDKPQAILDSLDSPQPGFGGSHHLPPYIILCISLPHLYPNGTFSWDSQSGVPKLSWFGLPGLWAFITSRSDLRLGRGLKQTRISP